MNIKTSSIVYKNSLEAELIARIEPVLEGEGLGLRDLEWAQNTLSISIERPKGDLIGIGDCEKVHHLLSPMLDVWDLIPSSYNLEIASPGECPALRTLAHFQNALNGNVEFQTIEPIPVAPPAKPRKNWKGQLKSYNEATQELVLLDGGKDWLVPMKKIKNAVLKQEWKITSEGKKEK